MLKEARYTGREILSWILPAESGPQLWAFVIKGSINARDILISWAAIKFSRQVFNIYKYINLIDCVSH